MRLVNCRLNPMTAKVPSRPPTVAGAVEMRWPHKVIALPSHQPVDVPESEGTAILERWGGKGGVMEVRFGVELDEVLLQGMQERHDALVKRHQAYVEDQQGRRAMGNTIRLPRPHDRAIVQEIKKLEDALIAKDPTLQEIFRPVVAVRPEEKFDPIRRELESFGIPAQAVQVIPGQDIDGL